jgi:hypothetical protein
VRSELARRIRWGNVARAAAALGVLALVIAWPRLAPPAPRVPADAAIPLGAGGDDAAPGPEAAPPAPRRDAAPPARAKRRPARRTRRREPRARRPVRQPAPRGRTGREGRVTQRAAAAPTPAPTPAPPAPPSGPTPADPDPATAEFGIESP